jgi:hypothetical protein
MVKIDDREMSVSRPGGDEEEVDDIDDEAFFD